MPRLRVIPALLLTIAWCSAAWHVELESIGLILAHSHHHHDDHALDHTPGDAHEAHEQVFTSDVVKNQTRAAASVFSHFVAPAFADWLSATESRVTLIKSLPPPTVADPPSAHVWRFVQRCAPESAAPPCLG